MDFSLTEEQQMLQDTVQRLIRNDYGFEKRQEFAAMEAGFSHDNWRQFAELGLLGLVLSEENGGFGAGGVEQMLVMEELGRGLVLEPYLASALIAARLLERTGSAEQKQAHLPGLIEGRTIPVLAHREAQARYDRADVATTATQEGDGYRLDGSKSVILHGGAADLLLVSARTSGARTDEDGISLFLVDPAASGVAVRDYPTMDALHAADIELAGVTVSATARLGAEGAAFADLDYALDCGVAALCADTLGAAAAATDMTLEYVRTRKQFGVAIGSFQVLQHRLVDMTIELEQMRSMVILAASRLQGDAAERRRAVSAAKFKIDQAARFIGQQAIQLHGGIGMTDEYAVGHFFKRITLNAQRLGDADHHLQRFRGASRTQVAG